MSRPVTPTIHARGAGGRLDAVLDLVTFAARPCPLTTSLDELPRRIGAILGADVCSVYLLEGEDLVMRGNVGFPAEALGAVRLAVGEGVTGMAVECMRPISVDAAPAHASYRHFPSLGEERFPVFLAVPVAGPSGPLGALVLQRREPPGFDRSDVELAAALTAPIAAATERARLVDALRVQRRAVGGGTRRVTLSGRPQVPGRAVGAVCAFRRPAARQSPATRSTPQEARRALDAAISQATRTLDGLEARAIALGLDAQFITATRTIVADGRMRERVLELVEQGDALGQALGRVAGEAARTAAQTDEAFRVERARQIADVCEALIMLAAGDRRAEVPRGSVLVGDQVTIFDALVSARSQPAAVVLAEEARGPVARTLLTLIGAPTVVEVGGLFRWVADGDIVLVDADHGLVRLNPSRAEVSTVRVENKRRSEPDAG